MGAPSPKASTDKLFDGGGEMGSLMRSLDWSKTALGPVTGWSSVLRAMVGVVLRSPAPMHLVWGPELVQLYNDAYRPLLGGNHPIVGQPAKESWAEVWHLLGPKYAAGLAGQPATWSDDQSVTLNRHGFPEETYFKAAFTPVPDEATASGIGGVLASVVETTEQVRKAAALSQAHADAERARTLLFTQLMQAPVPVCVLTGPEFVYSLANPLYLTMLNRTDIVGKTLRSVYPELPQDSPVFQVFEGVFSTGVPYTAEEFGAFIDKGNGPEDGYYKFTAQPVRDASGKVTEIIMVGIDITAHVLARRRIEALVGELRQADERKDEFLATLAHELRNPMAAISMALSMLELSGGDPVKSAPHQTTARRQMQSLVRMVDDLLDISRITRGTVELRKERTSLTAIVHNAASVTRAAVELRQHGLEVTAAAGAFPVDADATRIEQVVVNLLSNAIKYTDPGGTLSVRLDREVAPGAAEAVLRVRDSGRGIPADMLDKIFDLFVQAEPSLDRTSGGLGLGLTLVKRMVELHGGTIRAHSEGPGKGSEFVVRLPLASEALPGPQNAEGLARPLPLFTGKRRVLVVEDGDDLRLSFYAFLTQWGHEVAMAVDGPEGVAKILELLPDVSFVDLGLPGIDGYEVARRVRASPGGDQLYLVALTGYGGADVRAKVKAAGFNLHLTKPVDVGELAKLVGDSRA